MQRISVLNATAWVGINDCRGMLNAGEHLADVALPPAFHLNSNDLEMQLP